MLRILLRIDRILARLLSKGRLTGRLPEPSSRLQARLPYSETVLGGIPDEFVEEIIFSFVVNDDGGFVDLAAHADDIATDNRGRVGSWNRLGSRITLIRAYGSSCCWRVCAGD